MNLQEVIDLLESIKEKEGGEIIVFVNGEHGESEPEIAKDDHFSYGEAEITLGGDINDRPHGIRSRDKIMQIGGY